MNQKHDMHQPILVTGAAGQIGGVGFKLVEFLCAAKISVRAMVRRLDDRSQALVNLGAEVVVGDLTEKTRGQRVMSRLFFH